MIKSEKIINLNKKRKKKPIIRYLLALLLLALIVFLIFNLYGGKDTKIYTANYDTIQKTVSGIGIIIRDEKVYYAPLSGGVKYFYPEAYRIRKGERVCEIINTDYNTKELKEKLANINKQIEKLAERGRKVSGSKGTPPKNAVLEELRQNIRQKDLTNINYLLQDMQKVLAPPRGVGKDLERLYVEKKIIEEQLNNSFVTLRAHESGVVSYTYDGLEEVLLPKNLDDLEIEALENINSGVMNLKSSEVKVNNPVLKIVDNLKWYLAVVIPDSDLQDIKFLNHHFQVNIIAEKTYSLSGKAINVKKEENSGKILLVFEMNETFEKWLGPRKHHVQIIVDSATGVCVPLCAIVKVDGKQGVFVLNSDKERVFKEVKIVTQNKNYAVVKGIKTWENIIENPKF